VGGALVGAAFFLWIAGPRALDPGEIGWLMRFDWPIHFFGWHFFRAEPWHWPPGLIERYYAPLGTSIGFTDAIPLAAFLLKPVQGLLPATLQYIGWWLFLCFTLQGAFGAWLIAQATSRAGLQIAGAALFVLMPVLLIRIGHPALCSHWLLLWALVIATRPSATRHRPWEWGVLGLIAGLIHPYLAVMALALLAALAVVRDGTPLGVRAGSLAAALVATVTGWWASGLFSVAGAESLGAEGLGHYSMNLLGPIIPAGWSRVMPDLPRATTGQDYEGFQYPGLGILALVLVALAAVVLIRRSTDLRRSRGVFAVPVVAVSLLMAIYALSPRVTLGASVLFDLSGPLTSVFATFRATGRFFWPMAYAGLAWAIVVTARRFSPRAALAILVAAIALQLWDLHGAHEARRQTARDPAFYAWEHPMGSPVWHQAVTHYDHLVLYPPPQCGASPVAYEPAAYLAGLHHLSINAGGVARPDPAARLRYCHDLGESMKAGDLDDASFYLVPASEVDSIKQAARRPVACGAIEGVWVCVTSASYQRWRDLAALD
jgi:hypothetical protein